MSSIIRASVACAALVIALALVLPAAAAAPIARATVHPGPDVVLSDGAEPPQEPYYVTADAHDPEAPDAYSTKRDCSVPAHPREPSPHAPLRSWTPRAPEGGSFEGVTPECAWQDATVWVCAVDTCTGGAKARFAYDATTGDYAFTVAAEPHTRLPVPGGLPGAPAFVVDPAVTFAGIGVSGNSGVGHDFDCVGCPSPP